MPVRRTAQLRQIRTKFKVFAENQHKVSTPRNARRHGVMWSCASEPFLSPDRQTIPRRDCRLVSDRGAAQFQRSQSFQSCQGSQIGKVKIVQMQGRQPGHLRVSTNMQTPSTPARINRITCTFIPSRHIPHMGIAGLSGSVMTRMGQLTGDAYALAVSNDAPASPTI